MIDSSACIMWESVLAVDIWIMSAVNHSCQSNDDDVSSEAISLQKKEEKNSDALHFLPIYKI